MKKIPSFLTLLVFVSLSCSSATNLFTEPGLVEATGPILDMTVAASLDDQGQPVDAAFTYPVDQPEMVVLVRIGDVVPGPLTFSWYRVTEAGDEPLFAQTVPVEAGGAAFSTGLNPGILAAGTYKVVATFAGQSQTIAWDVAELQPETPISPVGTSASAAGAAPTPGPSGTTPIYDIIIAEPGEPGEADAGAAVVPSIIQVNRANQVKFSVWSAWTNAQKEVIVSPTLFTVQVRVGISGLAPDESRDYNHIVGFGEIKKTYFQDPCKLPGGSDLPGTSITVSAGLVGSTQQTVTAVLGSDSSLPIVQLVSEPSNGAKVKEGGKIELTAIAEELKSGGSWQTGISKIEIFVMGPPGEELLKKEYNEYENKSCGEKSWKQTTEKKIYEVPAGVKGDIRICAFGYDFAGNTGKTCYIYHTGDQLKGKLKQSLHQEGPSAEGTYTLEWQVDGDLSLTQQADGTLSGTAQIEYFLDNVHFQSQSCGTVHEWIDPIQLTLPVTGTWTEDVIDFHMTTDVPIMATKAFTGCGDSGTEQLDLSWLAGLYFHAAWDGQAYTADETSNENGAEITVKIHLEPPAPGVGFSPGPWAATSGDRASVELTDT